MEISFDKARFLHGKHGFEFLNYRILVQTGINAIFFGKDKPYHCSMPVSLFGDKTIYHLLWTDKGRQFLLNCNKIIGRTQQKVMEFMGDEENLRKSSGDKDFIKEEFYLIVCEVIPNRETVSLIFNQFFENFEEKNSNKILVTTEMFQELFKSLNPKFRQLACFQDNFPLENDIFLLVTSRMIWYTVVLAAEMIRTCTDGKIEKFMENQRKSAIPEEISEIVESIVNDLDAENDKSEKIQNSPKNSTKNPETIDIFSTSDSTEIKQELVENEISVQNEQNSAVSEGNDKNDKIGDKSVESNENGENIRIIEGIVDKVAELEKEKEQETVVEKPSSSLEWDLLSLRDKFHSAPLIFHQHLLYSPPDYWPYLLVSNQPIPIHRNVISNPKVFSEFRQILIGIRQNAVQIYDSQVSKFPWKDAPSVKKLMKYVDWVCEKILGKFYVKNMTSPISRLFGLPSISIPLQSLLELRRRLAAHFTDQHVDISDELLDSCFEALARHVFAVAIDLIPFLVGTYKDNLHNCFLLTPSNPNHSSSFAPSIFHSPSIFQNEQYIRLLGRLSRFLTVSPNLLFRSADSPCLWIQIPSESDDSHLLELLLNQGLPREISPRVCEFLTGFMSGIRHKMRMMLATGQLQRIADGFFLKSATPELLSPAFAMKASEFVSSVLVSLLNTTFPVYSLGWKAMTERTIQSEWWKIPTWERANRMFLQTAARHHPIWSTLCPLSRPSPTHATLLSHIRLHLLRFVITLACDTLRYTLKIQTAGNEQYFVKYDGQFESVDDFGYWLTERDQVAVLSSEPTKTTPQTNLLNPEHRSLLERLEKPNLLRPPFFGSEF